MKREIRKRMLALRNNLLKEEVDLVGQKVFCNLLKLPEFCSAESCFCYVDFKNEVSTKKIREYFSCKTLLVPVVQGDIMQAVKAQFGVQKNSFGIDEPAKFEVSKITPNIAIIPLLACDKSGNRIGFGKGYYDKWLFGKNLVKIGVCYDFQVLESVPSEPTDIKLDYIVTEKEIIKV